MVSITMIGSAILLLAARRSLTLDTSTTPPASRVKSLQRAPTTNEEPFGVAKEGQDQAGYDVSWVYAFIIILCIAYLGRSSISQTILYFSALPDMFNASSFEVSLIAMGPFLSGIVLAPLLGWLGDRSSPRVILLSAMFISVVTPLAFQFATSIPQMVLLSYIQGSAGITLMTVGYAAISAMIPPERRAELLGKYNAARMTCFGLSGTLIGGPVADYCLHRGATEWMAYVITFRVSSLLGLLATVLFILKFKKSDPVSGLR